MRLLETNKPEIDLKKEFKVALTLEEIATIYAVFAQESTRSTQEKLNEQGLPLVATSIDGCFNDLPYTLYLATEDILHKERLLDKEDI